MPALRNVMNKLVVCAALAASATNAVAYLDTARLVGSNDLADFYVYTGSVKKGQADGDYTASTLINFKKPREDGTRSAFRNVSFHCADPSSPKLTIEIDVGHAQPWADGAQTYSVGRAVGQRLTAAAGTANALSFDLVCAIGLGRSPSASLPPSVAPPPSVRAEMTAPRNAMEAYEEQERRRRVERDFERDKKALTDKRKREAEDELIQSGYIVRCEQTPHMIGGFIFLKGQRYPFERWNLTSYDQRGWRIKDPDRYTRQGNVLQIQGSFGASEFFINESVFISPVVLGEKGLLRRECTPISGTVAAL